MISCVSNYYAHFGVSPHKRVTEYRTKPTIQNIITRSQRMLCFACCIHFVELTEVWLPPTPPPSSCPHPQGDANKRLARRCRSGDVQTRSNDVLIRKDCRRSRSGASPPKRGLAAICRNAPRASDGRTPAVAITSGFVAVVQDCFSTGCFTSVE